MNDRFKFRVWNKLTHSFTTGGAIKFGGLCFVDEEDLGIKLGEHQELYIIEQCTGLKDKNGNLIYEGDIVLFNDDDYPWQIKWNEVFVRWVLYSPLGSNEDGEEELTDTDTEYLKIIGNIHEQPEQKDVK